MNMVVTIEMDQVHRAEAAAATAIHVGNTTPITTNKRSFGGLMRIDSVRNIMVMGQATAPSGTAKGGSSSASTVKTLDFESATICSDDSSTVNLTASSHHHSSHHKPASRRSRASFSFSLTSSNHGSSHTRKEPPSPSPAHRRPMMQRMKSCRNVLVGAKRGSLDLSSTHSRGSNHSRRTASAAAVAALSTPLLDEEAQRREQMLKVQTQLKELVGTQTLLQDGLSVHMDRAKARHDAGNKMGAIISMKRVRHFQHRQSNTVAAIGYLRSLLDEEEEDDAQEESQRRQQDSSNDNDNDTDCDTDSDYDSEDDDDDCSMASESTCSSVHLPLPTGITNSGSFRSTGSDRSGLQKFDERTVQMLLGRQGEESFACLPTEFCSDEDLLSELVEGSL